MDCLKNVNLKRHTNTGFTLIELAISSTIITILSLAAYKCSMQMLPKQEAEIFFHQLQHIIKLYKIKAMFSNSSIILCGSKNKIRCSNDWTHGILVISNHQKLTFYPGSKYGRVSFTGFASSSHTIELLPTGFTHNNGHFTYRANNSSYKKQLFLNKAAKSYIKD
jgi:prepilin-type N-terminal cleavage/methylation domain-containing protein